MLGWLVVERLKDGHATTLGAASGAVAGLVAITPCAGFVGGMDARSTSASSPAPCASWPSASRRRSGSTTASTWWPSTSSAAWLGSLLLGFFADAASQPARHQRGRVHLGGGWSTC